MRLLVSVVAAVLLAVAPVSGEEVPDPIVREATQKKAFVLAEFISQACPACDEMRPVVEALLARHPNLIHQVHDADAEVDLARKYRVRCVPVYLVVDPEGVVKFNDVGVLTQEELDQILRKAGL